MSNPDEAIERGAYKISFAPVRPTARLPQADSSDKAMTSASWPTRFIYVLALLVSVLPLTGSGWVSLALGAGSGVGVASVIMFGLAMYRVVLVLRRPAVLDAPVAVGLAHWCRVLGVGLASIGLVVFSLRFFIGPIGHALFPRGSDNGIEFFVIGLGLALLGGFAPMGLLLFEFSRMRAFEKWLRKEDDIGVTRMGKTDEFTVSGSGVRR